MYCKNFVCGRIVPGEVKIIRFPFPLPLVMMKKLYSQCVGFVQQNP